MASSALLRATSSQLRQLFFRTASGMTQHCQRYCQDDSRRRDKNTTPRKNATDRKFSNTKAAGPAISLLEKDLQDIVQERERHKKLQVRSSLQRRLDLLLSLGCTMDQIQNKVKVLDLSEQAILKRVSMLKEIGRTSVTVSLLLSSSFSSLDLLRRQLQRREELDSAFCSVLQCSLTQLDQLKALHPSLNRIRCLTAQDVMEKSQLLYSYGITSEEIKACPAVLNVKVSNIRERLDTLKAMREEGKIQFDRYPLKTVAQRTRDFKKCIKNAINARAELDGSRITHSRIAERLGVTAKDIEDASINFYKLGPSSALKKIDYLLGEGITSQDIVSHIYIMKYRLETLQRAMEKSKSVVVSLPPPIYIILSFLRSGCLPKRSFVWSRQRIFVASLFGVQTKELPVSTCLRPLWSCDRIAIKRNFDFLISEGFSAEDMFGCLMLLAHDPDHLQAYYRSLWERPELAAYVGSGDDARMDRKQTLCLLQYVIEKDMNFTSSVFNAEVEVEPGSSECAESSFDEDGD
ncbi:uncharacterized protein LOC143288790 [Babylonia areolata]|uniref:uncharacterized protein LOC143288790 n=1 Tax=Babylonia areolata TaxID=304850 RepID=UPI003FD54976